LIRDGITGVAAQVSEPYLDATIRPQILFPAYLAGFNLAESFYLAMPSLSWQTLIVGDPLCTPFPRKPLSSEDLHQGIDPETELPALFAERRLALLSRGGLQVEALKLVLKAEARLGREDRANSDAFLARAVELEPRLAPANLQLAAGHEERGEYDRAIDRYRRVLAVEPQNIIALNNLAYALAERQHLPKEGLPLAEKAYRLAPTGAIADTLGWIHHLLGDDRAAAPFLEGAVISAPDNVDVLIHAAIVHAALNDLAKARRELDAAEKLNPKIGERADVKALRERLKAPRSR
jgi:tetratricopeptide (TPR) repeat protein